jgi:hypothetical protein
MSNLLTITASHPFRQVRKIDATLDSDALDAVDDETTSHGHGDGSTIGDCFLLVLESLAEVSINRLLACR